MARRSSRVVTDIHALEESVRRNQEILAGSGLNRRGLPTSGSGLQGVTPVSKGGTGTKTELDIHVHVYNEDLTSQVGGGNQAFATELSFRPGSLCIYEDGLRQRRDTDYTEDATYDGFNMTVAPTGTIIVDYVIHNDEKPLGGFGQGPFGLTPFGF